MDHRPKKLLDQVREAIQRKHYSSSTGESYANWIKRFMLFHGKRHPSEMGAREVEAFLTYLAVEQRVAASTRNQALSALLFLYREVLGQDVDWPIHSVRAERPRRLPTVLSEETPHGDEGISLPTLLHTALTTAMIAPIDAATRQALHARRSRAWVAALAAAFLDHYRADPDVRVLSKHDPSHVYEFGLNELLYDVLVCRVGVAPAARHNTTITYVREALWQVESEFARDSRQAVFDMNKLVLGAAGHKLFVGPRVSDEAGFLAALLPAARCCSGEVYAALVPHPADWDGAEAVVRVWRLAEGEWAAVA